ncbi:hypothetical protein ACGFK1_08735 [Mycobacterium sp. NPDC048908]|uniref:hypothetical protein n=1 Tax=Mycobacterium sp. NPDC048908 TaxID=3364292 RepID=UPI0037226FAE
MSFDPSERWFELSEQFPIGPKRGGLPRRDHSAEEVAPGQIWQAYWRAAAAVVLIVGVDDATARAHVRPATLEPGVEDRSAIVVDAETSPLHGSITIWPETAAVIPFAVLGECIGSIPVPLLGIIKVDHTTAGLRYGHADPPLGSGAALAIDALFDALDILQSAPGLQSSTAAKPVVQLQIPLLAIMNALQIPQARAMAIRMGKEPLTLEEADQLAVAADLPVDDVLAATAPLPDDLQRELQEPRWRKHIRRRAADGDEARARSRLGYEAYQLAARETGQGRELWRQRLKAVVATENG